MVQKIRDKHCFFHYLNNSPILESLIQRAVLRREINYERVCIITVAELKIRELLFPIKMWGTILS